MKLPLSHIAFELTDVCNLNCRYCYNIWKMPDAVRTPFNSYDKAMKALKEIFRQADISNIAFTGGEPFLAERMLELALFCRMEGKSVTMISNGLKGTKSDYKALMKMGISLFELPLHSVQPEIHDTMTRIKGSWQKSLNSINTIMDLGGYLVSVIVLTKYNVDVLAETLDFHHSLGIHRIMMNRYNIGGCGIENPNEVSATAEQLHVAFRVANKKSEELGLVISSNVCSPTCLLNPADYPRIAFGNCSFDVLRKPITLDINGNIRLCNHSPIVAGNIFEKDIADILYSDYAESWNQIIPDYCNTCEWWNKCKGGCRAASEQMGWGLEKADPVLFIDKLNI